jgi:uncharacterized SAM-binding protein YcdF (DUF218 family)
MVFFLSKTFWLIAQPLNTIVLLMIAGLALRAAGRARAGLMALNAGAIYLLTATIVPLGQLLLLPLESRFEKPVPLPEHVDGIIVLGGAISSDISHARGEVTLGEPAERVTALVALAHRYPDARLVYSSGNADFLRKPGGSEAGMMRDFLSDEGVTDDGRVILEDRSRTTWENVVFSQALLHPKQSERWLLVTSAWHMPRAVGIFRRRGWPVIPYPVDYRTVGGIDFGNFSLISRMDELDVALKEWIGLVAYYAMGRTASLFPGS